MPSLSPTSLGARRPSSSAAAERWVSWILVAGLMGLTGVGVAALSAAPAAGAEIVNRVLLRVNDRILTLFDYEVELATRRSQIARSVEDPAEQQRLAAEAPMQVLRTLFDELLVLSRADQLALTVGPDDVEQAVVQQLQRAGISTEDDFRTALEQWGMTPDQYRDGLRRRLLFERVTGRELYPRIVVGDEELRRIYGENAERFTVPEQRQVREIVVLEATEAAARQSRTERIREQWIGGASPAELATAEGADAARFIDIGWVSPGDLAPELEAAAKALAPGTISEPVDARGGLHLIEVVDVRPAALRSFEEVRPEILNRERGRRLESELETYLGELEEKSYFRSDLPSELAGFRTKSGRALREDALEIFRTPTPEGEGSEVDGSR